MKTTALLNVLALLLSFTVPAADSAPVPDEPKYKGQIGSKEEYQRFVADKGRELAIQGGFVPGEAEVASGAAPRNSKDPYARWANQLWVDSKSYGVGDTIHMEFHIGVVDSSLKLSTKAFPPPQPVLHIFENGVETQQIKFTKGAC